MMCGPKTVQVSEETKQAIERLSESYDLDEAELVSMAVGTLAGVKASEAMNIEYLNKNEDHERVAG